MAHRVWPAFVLFFACGGASVGPPAPIPPPPAEAATPAAGPTVEPLETTDSPPAVAKPSLSQSILNELAKGGWRCVLRGSDPPSIDCPADAAHTTAVRITLSNADSACTSDDPCFLRLVSYDAPRAFGTPCEKFEDAMNDLVIAAHHFSVTCNDTTTDPMTSQQFGFTTALTVTDPSAPGVLAALPMHQADRVAAIQKLVSIKAIRRPKGPGSGEKHDVR